MGEQIASALQYRKQALQFYAPFRAIRPLELEKQFEICVEPEITRLVEDCIEVEIENHSFFFLLEYLPWDTAFFKISTYKLYSVLYAETAQQHLTEAILELARVLPTDAYVFIEIPSEDTSLMQALGLAGWPLIETRLTYWRGNLSSFTEPRYSVRAATNSDIDNLKRVAREMQNPYDRFHADAVFDEKVADNFLATYIEESVNGFADMVLIPNESNTPADSFLTARYLKSQWHQLGMPISKMVLSAVSSSTNKGWYQKLITEMTYHLANEGAEYIFMNTQSTNLAVCHTWEKLGYQLGGTSHILRMPMKGGKSI